MQYGPDRTNDERVYTVSAEDENGDHHVFVTSNLLRAEECRQAMTASFETVEADWLDAASAREWGPNAHEAVRKRRG